MFISGASTNTISGPTDGQAEFPQVRTARALAGHHRREPLVVSGAPTPEEPPRGGLDDLADPMDVLDPDRTEHAEVLVNPLR